MDRQHRQIAEILNNLAETYLGEEGDSEAASREAQCHTYLQALYSRSREHFSDEETLMLEADYPDLPAHAHEHRMLLAELMFFIRDIEEGRDQLNLGALKSLKTWFISHVLSSDKEFAEFLQAQGEEAPAAAGRQAAGER